VNRRGLFELVRPHAREIAVRLVLVAIPMHLFWVLNERIMHGSLGYDEQFFVWGGWNITRGLRPYVDFFEFKPPLVFITHAFAVLLCGDKGINFRVFFTFLPMASVLFLHLSLLTRRIHKAISLALVCALVFAWVNPAYHDNALADAESIGLTYYFAGVAALIIEAGKFKRYFEVAGGALLACAALSKEPFTGAVIATWATAYLLNYGTSNFRVDAVRYLKLTALGVGIVVAGLCLYLGPTGSLRRYLELVGEYAALFRDPSTSYCVILGRWKPGSPLEDLRGQAAYIHAQFFNVNVIGYLTPFFVATLVFAYKRSKWLLAAAFATLLLALYAVTATNCQWPHYYNMALSGMFFFFIVGADSMSEFFERSKPLVRGFVCALFIVTMAVSIWPRYKSEVSTGHHRFPPLSEPVPGVFALVEKQSVPSDRIFTTGPPLLYMHVNRLSAVRESSFVDEFIVYYPGKTDVEKLSGLRAQLIKNRPKIVILDPEHAHRKRRHLDALIYPFLAEFHYKPMGPNLWLRPD
jgi:hypothetical protein